MRGGWSSSPTGSSTPARASSYCTRSTSVRRLHPVPIITFQDLKKDPIKELKKVLRYLKVEVNQARLECLEEHTEGHMKRTQQSVADPYNDQVKRTINKIIKTANNLLIKKKKVKILDYLVK